MDLMATPLPYSELEYLILAFIGSGVNSGYAMRKAMNVMKGGRWSSESGSIYRVLKRLERDGLISEARKAGVPKRTRTEYALTDDGDQNLKSWISSAPTQAELGYIVDPMRTRGYFLNFLSHKERERTVQGWLKESKKFIASLKEEAETIDFSDPLKKVAFSNVIMLAEARHAWLKKMRKHLKAMQS